MKTNYKHIPLYLSFSLIVLNSPGKTQCHPVGFCSEFNASVVALQSLCETYKQSNYPIKGPACALLQALQDQAVTTPLNNLCEPNSPSHNLRSGPRKEKTEKK